MPGNGAFVKPTIDVDNVWYETPALNGNGEHARLVVERRVPGKLEDLSEESSMNSPHRERKADEVVEVDNWLIEDDDSGNESSNKRAEKFLGQQGWKENGQSSSKTIDSEEASEKTTSQAMDAELKRDVFKRQSTALQSTFAAARARENARQNRWSWVKAEVFGIIPSFPGMRGSRLIHPLSPFGQFIVIVSTIFLLYTALVVPVVIAFTWDVPDPCWRNPLLELDMVVDAFFMLEICLHFVTGTYYKGVYRDDMGFIAHQYCRGGLTFDLITSVPFSYVEFYVLQKCSSDGTGSSDISKFRFTRLVKPLRIVRMVRVLRAMKTVDISTTIERMLRIPPIFSRLLRVLFTIMTVTHLTASFFWLVKVAATNREGVGEFLEDNGLSADASFLQKYILSVYFVQTVFTTVGFGDVHATNTAEQVVCILIMLMGVMVFGTLLAEVESGLAEMRLLARERGQFLQRLKNFLRDKSVPLQLERRILDWVDFEFSVDQQNQRLDNSMSRLNPDLKRELEEHLLEGRLGNVAFLDIPHAQDMDLQCDVYSTARSVLFPKGTMVYDSEEESKFMLILQEGNVRVTDKEGENVAMLQQGDCIGEWNLMGEHDPKSHFGLPVVYTADTHVHCMRIEKEHFDDVLRLYPEDVHNLVNDKLAGRRASTLEVMEQSFISRSYQIAAAKWNAIVLKKLRKHRRETHLRGLSGFGATGADLLKGIQRKGGGSPLPRASSRSPDPRGYSLSRPGSPPVRGSSTDLGIWRDGSGSMVRPPSTDHPPCWPPFAAPSSEEEKRREKRMDAMEGDLGKVAGNVGRMRVDLDALRLDVSGLVVAVNNLTQVLAGGGAGVSRPETKEQHGQDAVAKPRPELSFGDYQPETYEAASKSREFTQSPPPTPPPRKSASRELSVPREWHRLSGNPTDRDVAAEARALPAPPATPAQPPMSSAVTIVDIGAAARPGEDRAIYFGHTLVGYQSHA